MNICVFDKVNRQQTPDKEGDLILSERASGIRESPEKTKNSRKTNQKNIR